MGSITAQFPGEPPRQPEPEVAQHFEQAVDPYAQQKLDLETLESQRQTPYPSLELTPGGMAEQVASANSFNDREMEIRALQEEIGRDESRSR